MTAPEPARAAAAARLPDRIAFLGFGLIGGSIALALREAGSTSELVAWTPGGSGPRDGVGRGLLDEAASEAPSALDGAGLVILAGPPLTIAGTLNGISGPMRTSLADGATITDVASTKSLIVKAAEDLGLPFVGGHPMAGRETSGVGAATADLFVDRPWVIVPTSRSMPVDLERVIAMATAVGGRPTTMSAADHDAAVAAISHLPLVIAAALAQSVAGSSEGASTWPTARRLAAAGWSDMTRLARGDPEMGAGILSTNAGPIADRLISFRRALDAWIELLQFETGPKVDDVVRARLHESRAALERKPDS